MKVETDKDIIRSQLPLGAVCRSLGIEPDPAYGRALCPWHERDGSPHTPSLRLWRGQTGERWTCDPCGRNGDLYDLIQDQRGCTFPEAVRWAAGLLAALQPDYIPPPFKSYGLGGSAKAWTEDERAHWSAELCRAQARAGYKRPLPLLLGFVSLDELNGYPEAAYTAWHEHLRSWELGFASHYGYPAAYLSHRDASGALTGIKVRRMIWARSETELRRRGRLKEKGKIMKESITGSRFLDLYGAWRGRTHGTVLVTEGEPDCLWASKQIDAQQLPIDVYALPRGAGSRVEPHWLEFLGGARMVWTAFDCDDPGQKMTERFGEAACAAGLDCRSFDFWPDPVAGVDLRDVAPDLSVLID
jgi:hypothetical protein